MENSYNGLFGISTEELDKIISEALRAGGDWCDLFFEYSLNSDLALRDGAVNTARHDVDYGCGIRVLKGEKTGYAYSESTRYEDLLAAARTAGSIATACPGIPSALKDAPVCTAKAKLDLYPMERDWAEIETAELVPVLVKLEKLVKEKDSRAEKVRVSISHNVRKIMMYNSLHELCCETRPTCDISVSVTFRQGNAIDSNRASRSLMAGAEMISEGLIEELACEAVKGTDERFEAKRPKGGQMSVVLAAGASGILLHEAMGHAFEADFNRKGQSVFSDKMGGRICRKGINIVDDGTVKASRGACIYDDEGIPGQKTYMVTDGVLTSYLHDRISAAYYKLPPTGNGRRESFRYHPIPRMRTTYMESGTDGSLQDLIGSVKRGIYVDSFTNGEVKIGEGDFTFFVKSGFLIENGRLTMPVKDINVIGNGPQALADIEAVASDLKIDGGTWTCGKGQSVQVSCGMPSVLVSKLTIGGE